MIKSPEGLRTIKERIVGVTEPLINYLDKRLMRKEVGIYQAAGWWEGITYDGFAGMDGKYWPDTHLVGVFLSNIPHPPKVGVIEFRRTRLARNEWKMVKASNTAGDLLPISEGVFNF